MNEYKMTVVAVSVKRNSGMFAGTVHVRLLRNLRTTKYYIDFTKY